MARVGRLELGADQRAEGGVQPGPGCDAIVADRGGEGALVGDAERGERLATELRVRGRVLELAADDARGPQGDAGLEGRAPAELRQDVLGQLGAGRIEQLYGGRAVVERGSRRAGGR